jgi:hypothetical protein
MYKVITIKNFVDDFKNSSYKDHFSYEGLIELFKHFEEMENEFDENYVFDIVGICGQFSEYPNVETALKELGVDSEKELRENYFVIDIPERDGIIVQVDDFPQEWQLI